MVPMRGDEAYERQRGEKALCSVGDTLSRKVKRLDLKVEGLHIRRIAAVRRYCNLESEEFMFKRRIEIKLSSGLLP